MINVLSELDPQTSFKQQQNLTDTDWKEMVFYKLHKGPDKVTTANFSNYSHTVAFLWSGIYFNTIKKIVAIYSMAEYKEEM